LSKTIFNQQNGRGALWFLKKSIQNGSPDGLALVNASSVVIHF